MHEVVPIPHKPSSYSHSSSPRKSSSAASPPSSPLPSPLAPLSPLSGVTSSTSPSHFRAAFIAHPQYGACSPFVETRILLLLRLATVAFLLGHLVFFACDNLLPVRRYTSWVFGAITLSQLFSVFGSLLEVLNDDDPNDDVQNDNHDAVVGSSSGASRADKCKDNDKIEKAVDCTYSPGGQRDVHAGDADVVSYHASPIFPPSLALHTHFSVEAGHPDLEKQTCAPQSRPRPLASTLAAIRIPVQQVALATAMFSIIAYWGALRSADDGSFYVSIVQNVAAPVTCIVDSAITCCLRFLFCPAFPLYVALHAAYAAAYAVIVVILERADPYPFFDRDSVPRNALVARAVGLCVACLAVPLVLHALSKVVSSAVTRWQWLTTAIGLREVKDSRHREEKATEANGTSETDESLSPGKPTTDVSKSTESRTTDLSASENDASHPSLGPTDDGDLSSTRPTRDKRFMWAQRPRSPDSGAGANDRDDDDRGSAPLSRDAKWYRVGSGGGVMAKSRSGSSGASMPSDNGSGWNRRRTRSEDEQQTSWSALDSPTPRVEDEYFKMPAVLETHGLQRDIVRLPPSMHRSDSNRSGRSSVLSRASSVMRSSNSRLSPVHSSSASIESSPQISSRSYLHITPDELSPSDDVLQRP